MNMAAQDFYTRVLKYIAIIVLGAIFLGSIFVVGVYVFVTPEHIRRAVIPVLEKCLNCEVDFSAIDVGILSGVSFSNLSLAEGDGEEPWFQVEKAVLRYRIAPLLGGRIVIDELSLETPVLVINRDSAGRVNIGNVSEDVFAPSDENSLSLSKREQAVLHISRVDVSDGSVLLRDFVFGAIPRLTRVQDLGLQMNDFAVGKRCSFICWGKVNGAPVDMEGSFKPEGSQGSFDLIVEDLDSVAFYPYYRRHLPLQINRMNVSTELRIQYDEGFVRLNGTTGLSDIDVVGKNLQESEFAAQELQASFGLKWDRNDSRLEIDRLNTMCDGLQSDLEGVVAFKTGTPAYKLKVHLQQWPLRKAAEKFPFALFTKLKPYSLAGNFSAIFTLHGDYMQKPDLVQARKISLDRVQIGVAHLRLGLSGDLTVEDKGIHAPSLHGKVGGEEVEVSVDCADWSKPIPLVQVQLHAAMLDMGNLLPTRPIHAGISEPERDSATAVIAEPGPFDIPVIVKGGFVCKQLVYNDFVIRDVNGGVNVSDNVLRLDGVTGSFDKSMLSAGLTLDLGRQGFTYAAQLKARNLSLARFMQALWPQSGAEITGTAQLNAELFGAGTHPLRARQNLFAHVEVSARNGVIDKVTPLKTLAQHLSISALSRHEFNSAEVMFEANPGNPSASFSLLTRSEPSRLDVEGNIDWQGRVSGGLKLYIAPEVMRDAGAMTTDVPVSSGNAWPVAAFTFAGTWDKLKLARTEKVE